MGADDSFAMIAQGAPIARPNRRVRRSWFSVCAAVLLLSGCGMSIPTDPEGSLEKITGGEMRVGVTAEEGMSTADDPPEGPLPDLANDFADSLDASTTWVVAGEESLVEMLETDKIDIALGRFTAETAWADRVAPSRPFIASEKTDTEIVALTPLGENAFLTEFETFIDSTGGSK